VPLEKVRKLVRAEIAHLDDDRYMAPDISKAAALVRSGAVANATAIALPEAWT
jgi:histidine ammonia-lyase